MQRCISSTAVPETRLQKGRGGGWGGLICKEVRGTRYYKNTKNGVVDVVVVLLMWPTDVQPVVVYSCRCCVVDVHVDVRVDVDVV